MFSIEEIIIFELNELEIFVCTTDLDFEIEKNRLLKKFDGTLCPSCGNNKLKYKTNELKCKKCGHSLKFN